MYSRLYINNLQCKNLLTGHDTYKTTAIGMFMANANSDAYLKWETPKYRPHLWGLLVQARACMRGSDRKLLRSFAPWRPQRKKNHDKNTAFCIFELITKKKKKSAEKALFVRHRIFLVEVLAFVHKSNSGKYASSRGFSAIRGLIERMETTL